VNITSLPYRRAADDFRIGSGSTSKPLVQYPVRSCRREHPGLCTAAIAAHDPIDVASEGRNGLTNPGDQQ
jgi:hypothetical protein